MIKTLKPKEVYEAIGTMSIPFFSAEPKVKIGTYWRLSIVSTSTSLNTNKWFLVKEARVSVTIVSWHNDTIIGTEDDEIDTVLDEITNILVDEWCSKISNYGSIKALYCLEWDCTTLLYTVWDRAYKIKDFLIAYEQ